LGPENAGSPEKEERTSEGCLSGITFDAGGLIALERGDRRIDSIVRTALDRGGSIIVPAAAFAQVVRNPVRQVRLWRMVQHEQTEVVPLDALHAQAVGLLLARSRTSDIADAHVVVCAQRRGHVVITSDPFDLKRLDPELRVIAV
jgi:predicted nucleic acid-binding protein